MEGAELRPPGAARALLAAAVVALVVTGVPLFVAPNWASEHFAWKVSPFVAMTAGGWCLGAAAFTAYAVIVRRWSAIRPCIAFPFAFGSTELAVAAYEGDALRTGEVLTWPYLAALVLSVAGGVAALAEGRRHLGPDRAAGGLEVTGTIRALEVGFVALVWSLAAVAFVAPERATNGSIFPEPLSLFSLRAFGVFYLSLGIAMVVMVADRRAEAFLAMMACGLVLVAPILLAAAVYGGTFDIAEHPLQAAYPTAYVAAVVGAAGSLGWARSTAQTR